MASAVIDGTAKLDEREDFVLYSSYITYRVLTLAGAIILGLARSHLQLPIDRDTLESLYFSCIQLLKRRSLQNDDLDARGATLTTQLWPSQQVFRLPDGTIDSHRVRLRNRGVSFPNPIPFSLLLMHFEAMGIVYDHYQY